MIQQELLVPRIIAFLEDYNSLLEGLNDELSAIESLSDWNKEAVTLNDVEISNLECDEDLYEEYQQFLPVLVLKWLIGMQLKMIIIILKR